MERRIKMKVLFDVCIGLSAGLAVGFLIGGVKAVLRRRAYSQGQVEATRRLVGKLAGVLKYFTFLCLALGLVWCVFFLLMGIVMPERADYANNMAELVVAVLTVISILLAFAEFLRRKKD